MLWLPWLLDVPGVSRVKSQFPLKWSGGPHRPKLQWTGRNVLLLLAALKI